MVAPEREVALALLDPLVLVVLMATLDLPDPLSVSVALLFQIAELEIESPLKLKLVSPLTGSSRCCWSTRIPWWPRTQGEWNAISCCTIFVKIVRNAGDVC